MNNMLNNKFLEWTHELTTLAYNKDMIIPAELSDQVTKLYHSGVSTRKALDTIIGIAHFKGIPLHTKPKTHNPNPASRS